MANIPAICRTCGNTHLSGFFISGTNQTLSGNKSTCPKCGGTSYLIDGVFDIKNDVLEIIESGEITDSLVGQIAELSKKAISKEVTPPEFLGGVATLDAALGRSLTNAVEKYGFWAVLFILSIFFSCRNWSGDWNRLIDQIITYSRDSGDVIPMVEQNKGSATTEESEDADHSNTP